MLKYCEIHEKFYSHLTPYDLANEEWRYAVIGNETSDRFIVSSCGRFADLQPYKCHDYHDLGRWHDAPGFGQFRLINVCVVGGESKKNADDDYLGVCLGEKMHRAHVVTARTFIGEIPPGFTVDYIEEGNAFDNRVGNLQIKKEEEDEREMVPNERQPGA